MSSEIGPLHTHPWIPARSGDVRSPCPALNALANHGILPRDGRNISALQLIRAVQEVYGFDATIASILAEVGVMWCGQMLHQTLSLHDLALHGKIEHDASLSHRDALPGLAYAPTAVDPKQIAEVLAYATDGAALTLADLARARVDAESRLAVPLDAIHAKIAQGEVALTLVVMGDGDAVSKERLWAWWGQEKLPEDYELPVRGRVTLTKVKAKADEVQKHMKALREV